jgi:hypothetical protein
MPPQQGGPAIYTRQEELPGNPRDYFELSADQSQYMPPQQGGPSANKEIENKSIFPSNKDVKSIAELVQRAAEEYDKHRTPWEKFKNTMQFWKKPSGSKAIQNAAAVVSAIAN